MQVTINQSQLELVEGDITEQDTEAIVNAANPSLLGGGGVDGAIHRAAGPELLEECRTLGGCQTGDAKITKGYRLKAKHVIHTVGPVYYRDGERAPELLASAYRRSLEVASENNVRSVSFPSISTGAYGYPMEEATPIALQTAINYLESHTDIELVRFVLFGQQAYQVYEKALKEIVAQRVSERSDVSVFVGIDGCKAGWFAVTLVGLQSWKLSVFSDIDQLWNSLSYAHLLLIDIPIGLCERGVEGRACDAAARRLLGSPRASSVFTPPVRPALEFNDREEASEKNYSLTGRRIGVQTWAIAPKIQEVDRFLRTKPEAGKKIREIHPEVLFWALNGCKAMSHKKSRRKGFEERLRVLRRHFSLTDALVNEALSTFPRNMVARDDILDALAAAVTALCWNGHLASIPEEPERDAFGLPMEMVYYVQTYVKEHQ